MKNFVYPEFLSGLMSNKYDYDTTKTPEHDNFKVILVTPEFSDDYINKEDFDSYTKIAETGWECAPNEEARNKYVKGGQPINFKVEQVDGAIRIAFVKSLGSESDIISMGSILGSFRRALVYRDSMTRLKAQEPNPEEPLPVTLDTEDIPDTEKKFLMCFDLASEATGIAVDKASVDLNFNNFAVEIRNK